MTAKDKLPKDHELAKNSKTMTAGVTASKLEIGAIIDIHGHAAKITHTDDADTMVQYANSLARRTFDTHALNSYLDMGVFPTGTALERPTAVTQRAVIEAVTGDCCYHVRLTSGSDDTPWHEYFTYANFIKWHMDNSVKPLGELVKQLDDYLDSEAAARAKTAEYMKDESQSNPFETDLQSALDAARNKIEILESALEAARVSALSEKCALLAEMEEADQEKDSLVRDLHEAKALISKQKQMHETVIAAYEEDINRLEAKAAILHPEPAHKDVFTLIQQLAAPEKRREADNALATMLSDGWVALNITVTSNTTGELQDHQRFVTLVRDLPAVPAPKLAEKIAEADLHIGAVPLTQRPPVQRPPMPANQTIIHQPVSRALTNNGPKPGETKRIPSLADIQARREKDNAEIGAIMQRGLDEQEVLRRKFAQTPSPFNQVGAQ